MKCCRETRGLVTHGNLVETDGRNKINLNPVVRPLLVSIYLDIYILALFVLVFLSPF